MVGNFLVGFSNQKPGLLPTLGTYLLSRESLLPPGKQLIGFIKVPGIAHLHTFRGSEERLEAHINPDFFASLWKRLLRNIVAAEAYKPFACPCPANGDGFNISLNGAGKSDLKGADISDGEVLALDSPARLLQGEGIVSVSTFKPWEAGLVSILNSAEERPKALSSLSKTS